MQATGLNPEAIGLDPALYAKALHYLFDRPVPAEGEEEWYWNIDEPEFEATPLEWTRIQTVLFAHAGTDLAPYSHPQVGMGLNYVMSNSVSNISHMANDISVPLADAMRMMQAFAFLWRDCIGPRLEQAQAQEDADGTKRLNFVCYMWFDVWPTFWSSKHIPAWRDALWQLFCEMLDMPYREVQRSALDGLNQDGPYLQRPQAIEQRIARFVAAAQTDTELADYARAVARGMVL